MGIDKSRQLSLGAGVARIESVICLGAEIAGIVHVDRDYETMMCREWDSGYRPIKTIVSGN